MKIIFANISHGFVYADDGSKSESMKFLGYSIPGYIEYFLKYNPDILCLTEVLLDDKEGNSEDIDKIKKELGLKYSKAFGTEESWIYIGKYYGLAILSKFPISEYESFLLPNPHLKITRPNGEEWEIHDKYAQFCSIEINGKKVNLFNLHYFALHHYGKKIEDPELEYIREELVKIFKSKDLSHPTIITGDFNNKGIKLRDAFPELFAENLFETVLETETTLCNGNDQLDHILITGSNLTSKNSLAEKYFSDHYALISEIYFK